MLRIAWFSWELFGQSGFAEMGIVALRLVGLSCASHVAICEPGPGSVCSVMPVMKIKYVKSNSCISLSAKEAAVVGKTLSNIQREMSVITPKIVVEKASDPRSPLHKYFEWDDTVAAQKHREWQARFLITSVHIVDAHSENQSPIRAFVNVSPDGDDGDPFVASRGYVATSSIAGKQNYESQVISYAKNQLVGWKKRFGNYREFFGVVKEIEKLAT